jgi:hypothetical protein
MEGAYRKKAQPSEMTSSLYQAPLESSAAGNPTTGEAPAASFAAALKEVSQKKDPTGWRGESPRKPFNPPRANFSGLSGLGSGGGSGGSGAGLTVGAFGTAKPSIEMASTRGLGSLSEARGREAAPIMSSLRAANASGQSAASQRTGDAAKSLSGVNFDGSRASGATISADNATALSAIKIDDLGAAPMNLKPNDYSGNSYKYEPVPAAVGDMDTSEEAKRQVVMAVAGALIGGMIGGTGGNVISMAIMMYSMTNGRSVNSGSNVKSQTSGKTSFYPSRRVHGPATRYS